MITGNYSGDNTIRLYARNEFGKFTEIKVLGFDPYFFVPDDSVHRHNRVVDIKRKSAKSIYGEDLARLTTFTPGDVPEVRKTFETHFEADIVFVRRMMIDAGIYGGFEIPGNRIITSWKRIQPCDFSLKPRTCFCDIETYAPEEQYGASNVNTDPVIINGVYDSRTQKYLSMVLHPDKKTYVKQYAPDHKAIFFSSELNLLRASAKFLNTVPFDVYTAWYVNFDKNYQQERGEILRVNFPWHKTNIFDIMKGNRAINPKASDKLMDVVEDEKLDIPNYEPFKTEFWENDMDKAILVNKSHVEAIVKLNQKHKIIDFFWEAKNLAGFEDMRPSLWHGSMIEILYLREAHRRGQIVPSKPSEKEVVRRKEKYKKFKVGGKTLQPPIGLFENLANFDASRYYIELLIQQNVSPEVHDKDKLGIMPTIGQYLVERRLKYDKLLNELKPGTDEYEITELRRKSVKFATESVIGNLGHEPSRTFDPEGYNKVTTKGQKGLLFIGDVCKDDGYSLMYGDTDGVLINMPLQKAKVYSEVINKHLVEFCKKEGLSSTLTVKLDLYFKKIIFKRKKGEDRGAKKRYAGHVIFENGKDCDYLHIKGFEYVRRDASNITKKIQHEIFEHILRGDSKDTKNYLMSEIKKIENGDYSWNDLAIPTTLHQNPESYATPQDYARGAIYSNRWFNTRIKAEDKIRMLYVKSSGKYPSTDVISVPNASIIPDCFEFDIEKIIEKTVKNKIVEIIELIGLTWKDVYHPSKSLLDMV